MENTLKNKAKFFAQYWGQMVLFHEKTNTLSHMCRSLMTGTSVGVHCLLLKPLRGITDEDAIEVAKLASRRHNRHYQPEEITFERTPGQHEVVLMVKGHRRFIIQITSDGLAWVDFYMGGAGREHKYCPGQYEATQYLQSKGYALPWMGLSVDQLVEYGWIKISVV